MSEMQIRLAFIWVIVMLIYLLGDVFRIYAGDHTPGEIEGKPVTQAIMMGISVLMLIPILMIFASITLDYSLLRPLTIFVAAGWILFNLVGLPTYPGWYDRFLLAVSMVFNAITIWYAWYWTV